MKDVCVNNDKIKVLWFANTAGNADEYYNSLLQGSGGWIKNLDKELQLRVELSVAFYHNKTDKFKYRNTTYYSIGRESGFISRIISRFYPSINYARDLDRYLEIIEDAKPDIVHIHGTENSFGCLLDSVDVPVVVSIQGIISAVVNKFFAGFDATFLSISKRNNKSLKDFIFPWTFRIELDYYRALENREIELLKKVKFIMGRTTWDRRLTRVLAPSSQYFHEDRILRDVFYEKQWSFKKREELVLHTTMGNSFYKGLEVACEAKYHLDCLGMKSVLNVAGVREDDLIVKIVKMKLRSRFPKDGINFLGMIDANGLAEQLLVSDIYVMPSHIENNANNLCEAMLLGLPCIASFVGGVGSLIENEVDGLLVQNGDVLALTGSILELSSNPELAIMLGGNARESALHRHDKNRIASALVMGYRNILSFSLDYKLRKSHK